MAETHNLFVQPLESRTLLSVATPAAHHVVHHAAHHASHKAAAVHATAKHASTAGHTSAAKPAAAQQATPSEGENDDQRPPKGRVSCRQHVAAPLFACGHATVADGPTTVPSAERFPGKDS